MYDLDKTIADLQAEYAPRAMVIECLKMVGGFSIIAALFLGFVRWVLL